MIRRAPVFAVLAAVALMLGASLSLALAHPTPSSLLTATALPLFDRMAYLPRLMRSDAPPPTSTATSTATATASPTATSTSTPVSGRCVDYVYPITLHKASLANNQPAWYQPVTLASLGLGADAEDSAIPGLNSSNSNSPRFRIYRNPNTVGLPANYSWTRWNGNEPQAYGGDLVAAMTGPGSLGQGFSERTPPPEDPAAIPLLNGVLEAGDWLASNTGNVGTTDLVAALNGHIANKTRMILPIHDRFFGQGNSNDSSYHVERFVEVRLLRYDLSPNGWFELALIEDYKTCGPTPPTATATSTVAPTASGIATSTATATPTSTPTPAAHSLRIDVSEQLSWYNPSAPSSHDLVIVQEYSSSMRRCWDSAADCPGGSRRIDYAAAGLRQFVNQQLVVRNEQGGDNRLAYVTFGQAGTKVVPFTSDTPAALAAFKAAIGDLDAPRTIPNSELTGDSNPGDAMIKAAEFLNDARVFDKYGRPVRLSVLLLTDGTANVFSDGPLAGITNFYTTAPFYCGANPAHVEDPLVQYTCPSQFEFPGWTVPMPPLRRLVKFADDMRNAKAVQFYAVLLGNEFGLTPAALHLNEVAPGRAEQASSPAQLQGLLDSIGQDLATACAESSSIRPAAGATVALSTAGGALIGEYTANSAGQVIVANLDPGAYSVRIRHLAVVAPQDPLLIARDYTRLLAEGSSTPVASTPLVMPDAPSYVAPAITLLIDDPANAQCP